MYGTQGENLSGCRLIALGVAAWLAIIQLLGVSYVFADDASSATQMPPKPPHIKSAKPIEYPADALRWGIEGTVLVEFNIDAKGKATGISIIRADNKIFMRTAREFYEGLRFDVPSDRGSDAWRYRFGMVFCIPPSAQVDTIPESPYPPVIVKSDRARGTPVLHPVQAASSGACTTF